MSVACPKRPGKEYKEVREKVNEGHGTLEQGQMSEAGSLQGGTKRIQAQALLEGGKFML